MTFRRFNHLNVPEYWERYFTKYPQGMTILESLFEWVSQVDSMVDNQNKLNTNVEQFRKEIDEFVGRFDERLQNEVINTLKEWQDSGFIDVVISEALQWQLDDYITTNEQDKLLLTAQLAQNGDIMDSKSMQQTKTVFVAHRGFNAMAPENTVASFDLAGYYGFDFAECDVRVTVDGKMVIIHDDTVDRTTNGSGSVKQLTFDYIRSLKVDAGNNIATYSNLKVPTFEEYINICMKWGTKPFIHVYDDSKLDEIISILKKYNIENKSIIGTTKENAIYLRGINVSTTIVVSNPDLSNLNSLKTLGNVIIGTSNATKELTQQIHSEGFALSDDNSDSIRNWNQAIRWGIDYYLINHLLPIK